MYILEKKDKVFYKYVERIEINEDNEEIKVKELVGGKRIAFPNKDCSLDFLEFNNKQEAESYFKI